MNNSEALPLKPKTNNPNYQTETIEVKIDLSKQTSFKPKNLEEFYDHLLKILNKTSYYELTEYINENLEYANNNEVYPLFKNYSWIDSKEAYYFSGVDLDKLFNEVLEKRNKMPDSKSNYDVKNIVEIKQEDFNSSYEAKKQKLWVIGFLFIIWITLGWIVLNRDTFRDIFVILVCLTSLLILPYKFYMLFISIIQKCIKEMKCNNKIKLEENTKLSIFVPSYKETKDQLKRTLESIKEFIDSKFEQKIKNINTYIIVDGITNLEIKETFNSWKLLLEEYKTNNNLKYEYNGSFFYLLPKQQNKGKRDSIIKYIDLLPEDNNNHFSLHVDSDTRFDPMAPIYCINSMNENDIVGSCGEMIVDTIGTGQLLLSQYFEYSFSHWFGKSMESSFGHVTCLPGAFSIWTVSFLKSIVPYGMNPDFYNLRKKPESFFQKLAIELGEDRFMTLIALKKEKRTICNLSAKAFTNAPENLEEFMIQRRRWIASTIANMILLLKTGWGVCRNGVSGFLFNICLIIDLLGFFLQPFYIFFATWFIFKEGTETFALFLLRFVKLFFKDLDEKYISYLVDFVGNNVSIILLVIVYITFIVISLNHKREKGRNFFRVTFKLLHIIFLLIILGGFIMIFIKYIFYFICINRNIDKEICSTIPTTIYDYVRPPKINSFEIKDLKLYIKGINFRYPSQINKILVKYKMQNMIVNFDFIPIDGDSNYLLIDPFTLLKENIESVNINFDEQNGIVKAVLDIVFYLISIIFIIFSISLSIFAFLRNRIFSKLKNAHNSIIGVNFILHSYLLRFSSNLFNTSNG